MQSNHRCSFTVGKRNWDFLTLLIKRAGLRRDAFIAKVLVEEIEELKALEANTDEESYIVFTDFKANHTNRLKVNVLLPKKLVDDLNKTCKQKNIRRSCFFNRFIEFLNVRCGFPLLQLASPRKTMQEHPDYWLERMAHSSPAILEFIAPRDGMENYEKDDPWIELSNYLDGFYSRVLNVTPDDPRRLTEEEQKNLIDRILNGDMEVNDETA